MGITASGSAGQWNQDRPHPAPLGSPRMADKGMPRVLTPLRQTGILRKDWWHCVAPAAPAVSPSYHRFVNSLHASRRLGSLRCTVVTIRTATLAIGEKVSSPIGVL